MSKLWTKLFLYTFFIVAGYSLAIGIYTVGQSWRTTYDLEQKYALSLLDRVLNLVEAKYLEIEDYRQHALEARKRELSDITHVVGGYIQAEYEGVQAGLITDEEAQKRVIKNVRRMLYGKKDYIWISDFNSVLISHPDPDLHGKDFSKILDVRGNEIVPPMVELARKQGQGYHSYWWNRLGKEEPVEKLTYSKLFAPWDWVYGTGVYIDDIEEEVTRKKKRLIEQLREIMGLLPIGRTGYMYIFDADKKMIIHPNSEPGDLKYSKINNPITGRPLLDELIAAAHRTDQTLFYQWDRPDDPGNYIYEKISWIKYFPGFKWYIASSVYMDELSETPLHLATRIIGISLLVLIFSLIVGVFFLKRILKPIEVLAWTAQQVRSGNLNVRSGISGEDEIGLLGLEFDSMVDRLRDNLETLDAKVKEKTRELSDNYAQLERANKQVIDGLEYAKIIQRAILPRKDELAGLLWDFFVIWHPKDLIGGDFYWLEKNQNGFLLAVADCTGHGVPGAIVTTLAATALSRVVQDRTAIDPAEILKDLNKLIQYSLNQHITGAKSDDGLDIGLCQVDLQENSLTFAGARLNLFLTSNGHIQEIKGDRQSIGYISSKLDYTYTNHRLTFDRQTRFYLATDGFLDQPGGEKCFPFGKRRLMEAIMDHYRKPLPRQKDLLKLTWMEYKGSEAQRDDVTVLGFSPQGKEE